MTQKRAMWVVVVLASLLMATAGVSQVDTGTPPFGSLGGGPFDTVNLGNLNVSFAVPVVNKAGRGMPFTYSLTYNSSVWTPVTSNGVTQWQPAPYSGWNVSSTAAAGASGYLTMASTQTFESQCPFPSQAWVVTVTLSNWVYHDAFGSAHNFRGVVTIRTNPCTIPVQRTVNDLHAIAIDSSGYTLQTNYCCAGPPASVTTTSGRTITVAAISQGGVGGGSTIADSNGNRIMTDGAGHFYDTVSSTTPVLTVAGSGTPASPLTFTYAAPADGPSSCNPITLCASYTMNYAQYTLATNFGVSGIGEYGPLSSARVSSISLPDGSAYTFAYEPTPGSCTAVRHHELRNGENRFCNSTYRRDHHIHIRWWE
jgi:hypothetical protein